MNTSLRTTLLLMVAATTLRAGPIDDMVANPDVWKTDKTTLVSSYPDLKFVWEATDQSSAVAKAENLGFSGITVNRFMAYFRPDGKLDRLEALLYEPPAKVSKDGPQPMNKEGFDSLVKQVNEALEPITKVKVGASWNPPSGSRFKTDGRQWRTNTTRYLLEYVIQKEKDPKQKDKDKKVSFDIDFVRLKFFPAVVQPNQVKPFVGATFVKRDAAKADVLIDSVPMFLAKQQLSERAAFERVLLYYGIEGDRDMNRVLMPERNAAHGTTDAQLAKGLAALAQGYKLRLNSVYAVDENALRGFVSDYNRIAKQKQSYDLDLKGKPMEISAVVKMMEPEIFRDVRLKTKNEGATFLKMVTSQIDQGIPIFWTVILGAVQEANLGAIGTHMRLIIGYNAKNNQILYTDPWGKGHEVKRLSADDAWVMTLGAATMSPR